MSIIENIDILYHVINYLNVDDLYILIQCSKLIRDIIGTSNIWDKDHECDVCTKVIKYINIREVYNTFLAINLSTKYFACRDYYSDSYYRSVIKIWNSRKIWNLGKMLNNINDIGKLYDISAMLFKPNDSVDYGMIFDIITHLSIDLEIRPEILNMIYIHSSDYTCECCSNIYITNIKFKYTNDYLYPINMHEDNFNNNDICYELIFSYKENFLISRKNNAEGDVFESAEETLAHLLVLSTNLSINYTNLITAVKFLFGRDSEKNKKQINSFLTPE